MIGILVILLFSSLLLWLSARRTISVLGLRPEKSRVIQFVVGFLLAGTICAGYNLLTTAFVENDWRWNADFTTLALASGMWWVFKSVIFEELLFRGALLYLLNLRYGPKTACAISGSCFGIYHWFSYGSFGNPVQMAIIFAMTGFVGFALAWSFVKTRSLYLPVALHIGWNLINIVVFSNGPLGTQMLFKANQLKPDGLLSLSIFLFQVFAFPVVAMLYVRWIVGGIRKD
ncbi:CPBP family intramembrane glutamic endopeptidase [Flavobacterium selenitireducens]|uniref:CPBP family intramembrane glutamic endopeptidase n=1 Tax=Flavobacterium selenitireducens TaxID=2722704 RepID=UPI00168A597C|nr:CPBP family intramembrane glutamic endopeptidase [Flavobacterium selenitireducens]MBD3583050.1 CPBP family intramembrane metalloprotease [Flavobacterium selenitireducens]